MTTTNATYIHEYSLFDDVLECLESCNRDMLKADFDYRTKMRQVELSSFFEGSTDSNVIMEKEGQGILAKIGEAVSRILKSIADFIKKLTGNVAETVGAGRTDTEIVSQIVSRHPDLKNKVVDGIKKEWFTYKDVAAYERDIVGLIAMLDKNKIDHETFKERLRRKTEEFTSNTKVIVTAGATIIACIALFPKLVKSVSDCKKTLQSITGTAEKLKEDTQKNYTDNDHVTKMQAKLNALQQMVGLTTKECQDRDTNLKGLSGLISRFKNSTIGTKLKMDDASFASRKAAAQQDAQSKKDAAEAAKKAKELADFENEERLKAEREKIKNRVAKEPPTAERLDQFRQDYRNKKILDRETNRIKKEVDDELKNTP